MFFDVRYMSATSTEESVLNPTDMHNAGWHTGFLFFMYGVKYQGKIFSEEVLKVFETCHTDAWNSCVTWQKCQTEQFNPINCKVCSQVSTGVCRYLFSSIDLLRSLFLKFFLFDRYIIFMKTLKAL